MKLLLDANISWKLIKILKPIFDDCTHVDLINLPIPAKDEGIWNFALENDYIIVTKDNDFLNLLELRGFPPKVILIRSGTNSSKIIADLIIGAKENIKDLKNNEYGLLEVYGPLKIVNKI